jgi:hypothetical protein
MNFDYYQKNHLHLVRCRNVWRRVGRSSQPSDSLLGTFCRRIGRHERNPEPSSVVFVVNR